MSSMKGDSPPTIKAHDPMRVVLLVCKAAVVPSNYSVTGVSSEKMTATLFRNCFDTATQQPSNTEAAILTPEDHGWTKLKTRDEWIRAVTRYFSPDAPPVQEGSSADRNADLLSFREGPQIPFTYSFNWVYCFPQIGTAMDYHWAMITKDAVGKDCIVEQAGMGGDILAWYDEDNFLKSVYSRGNCYIDATGEVRFLKRGEGFPPGVTVTPNYYVPDTHFVFKCRA
ncbi:hypothetical protein B484DRAFT_456376, partial [Ochromonadaceae sp. CCMP2298]